VVNLTNGPEKPAGYYQRLELERGQRPLNLHSLGTLDEL
jgi:hypothetical protein